MWAADSGHGDDPDQILIQTPSSLVLLVWPRHKENGR